MANFGLRNLPCTNLTVRPPPDLSIPYSDKDLVNQKFRQQFSLSLQPVLESVSMGPTDRRINRADLRWGGHKLGNEPRSIESRLRDQRCQRIRPLRILGRPRAHCLPEVRQIWRCPSTACRQGASPLDKRAHSSSPANTEAACVAALPRKATLVQLSK